MIYLINKGVEKKKSFKIMEKVRKGKGLTEEDIADMKASDVRIGILNPVRRLNICSRRRTQQRML